MKNKVNKGLALSSSKGFTLIEILVVIGIIALLATVVLIAINPARQFAQARNSQRTSNVEAILNAVGQRLIDYKGEFDTSDCGGATLPATADNISKADVDLRPCLVNRYMPELPHDPTSSVGSNTCVDTVAYPANCNSGDYDLGYTVAQDATTKRITVCAPQSANETAIQPTPVLICVTR